MEFTEICIKTNQKDKDSVADILQMVSDGIYIEDYDNLINTIKEISHIDLIDDALLKKDSNVVIMHMYIEASVNLADKLDFINERLTEAGCRYEVEIKKTEDEDWANNWKKYYKPFEIGEHLVIKPEWEEFSSTGRKILNIDPGLAFGTGTHETTKLCLEILETLKPQGKDVLDIGCGSGILSIAALLLGAESAVAIDIDPIAVKSSKRNALLNGLSLTVIEGDLVDNLPTNKKFDIVLANIIADAIISIAPKIKSYMRNDGAFICSGVIDERLDDVSASIADSGLTVEEIRRENGWVAIVAKHIRHIG